MTHNDLKNRVPKCFSKKYGFLLLFAVLFLSIGYATISDVNLIIDGDIATTIPSDLYITNVTITGSSGGASTANSSINAYGQLLLSSGVVLSNSNLDSTITMSITIKNNSDKTMYYDDIIKSSSFYSNNNIDYNLSGLSHDDALAAGDSISFFLIFKYSDAYKAGASSPYTNTLTSSLEFNFVDSLIPNPEYNVTLTGTVITHPSTVTGGSDLVINLGSSDYNVLVKMGGSYIYDFDYTGGVLTIPNVSGDVDISVLSLPELKFQIDLDNQTQSQTLNSSSLTDLVGGNYNYQGGNLSDRNINQIDVTLNYTQSGGNQQTQTNCVLTYTDANGQNQTQTQTVTFDRNKTTTSVSFTNIIIPPNGTFTIAHEKGANMKSSKPAVSTEVVTAHFDN